MSAIEFDSNSKEEYAKEPKKKKNRVLQFYKFLFYSIKVELKVHEFIRMVRTANIGELVLWILSLIFYCAIKDKDDAVDSKGHKTSFKNSFIWPQLIHVARAIVGLVIYYKFPKSFSPIEQVKQTDEKKLEETFFNDLVRDTVNETVIKPIQEKRVALFIYVGFTFFNILIDLISFLAFIANLHKATPNIKVVILGYVFIDIVYLVLDFRYVLWLRTLKYVFPPKYTNPIADAFYGAASKLKSVFKIGKLKTNPKNELPTLEVKIKSNDADSNDNKEVGTNDIKIDI